MKLKGLPQTLNVISLELVTRNNECFKKYIIFQAENTVSLTCIVHFNVDYQAFRYNEKEFKLYELKQFVIFRPFSSFMPMAYIVE